MTCRYCGSELPSDALFCGECGRAVLVDTLVGANSVSEGGDADAYARFAPPSTSGKLLTPPSTAAYLPDA